MKILYAPDSDTGIMPSATIDDEIRAFEGTGVYPTFGEEGDKPAEKVEQQEKVGDTEDRSAAKIDEGPEALAKLPSLEEMSKLIGDKTIPVIKKDGVKPEDKKEGDEQEAVTDKTNQPPARDLEGFGDKEKLWLKRMPFEAYEHFSKVVKESRTKEETYKAEKKKLETDLAQAREGKVQLPESYYDNPEAAWLMPEVRDVQARLTFATEIEKHWENQLIAVEEGKPFFDLVQGKDGKIYVADKETEVTAENQVRLKAGIQRQFQNAINQTGQLRGVLESTVTGFRNKHQERINSIRATEDKLMPAFSEANKDTEEYKVYQQVTTELPKLGIGKDNPAFQMLAKSCALNLIMKNIIESQAGKTKTAAAVKEDQRKAGPTGASFSGGAVKPQAQAPSLQDFAKYGLTLK